MNIYEATKQTNPALLVALNASLQAALSCKGSAQCSAAMVAALRTLRRRLRPTYSHNRYYTAVPLINTELAS